MKNQKPETILRLHSGWFHERKRSETRNQKFKLIRREVERITADANFNLRKDVLSLIKRAYGDEKNKKAKLALSWIIENAKIARKERLALCQDTGLPLIFIEVGKSTKISSEVIKAIEESVERAYKKNYLRKSLVDPLVRVNPSYKGALVYVDFNPKKKGSRITVFPKGFGSENKSRLCMFNPTVELGAIEDFIVDSVKKAGPSACPPFIVGVGIGGTSEQALLLAKKSLVGGIDKPNKDKQLASIERKLLKRINSLKIGPMGLGGKATCLAVKINKAPTHIAGLPVGVNISCWALRSASIRVNGKW